MSTDRPIELRDNEGNREKRRKSQSRSRRQSRSGSGSRATRDRSRSSRPSGTRERGRSPASPRVSSEYLDEKQPQSDHDSEKASKIQNKWWALAFLLVVIVYIGVSVYIALNKLDHGFGGLFSTSIDSGDTPINNSANPRTALFGVLTGMSLGTLFWLLATLWPGCIFRIAVVLPTAFIVKAIIRRSKKEGAAAGLAPSPYTSIIPLIVLWCFLALLSFNLYGRIGSAVKMLRSARHLNRGFLHRLWYFVLMTFLRPHFVLCWNVISIGAASYAFGPESSDGICGTTIVIGIAAFYLLTQFWITGTICETLASAAAGSFKSEKLFEPGIDTGFWRQFKLSLLHLLGTRARNGLLCDPIELQVWFLTNVIDRVPWVRDVFESLFGWYLRLLARAIQSSNRYIGLAHQTSIVAACHNHAFSYEKNVKDAIPFTRRGYDPSEEAKDAALGRPMGPLQRKLRQELGEQVSLHEKHWDTGLGSFLENHQTKSLLVFVALTCASVASCSTYEAQIQHAFEDPSKEGVSWLIVIWSFYSGFSAAYIMLGMVEAAACTMQVWLYDPYQSIDYRIRDDNDRLYTYIRDDLDVQIYEGPGTYDAVYNVANDFRRMTINMEYSEKRPAPDTT